MKKSELIKKLNKGKGEIVIEGVELVEKSWLIQKQVDLEKLQDICRKYANDIHQLSTKNMSSESRIDSLIEIINKLVGK